MNSITKTNALQNFTNNFSIDELLFVLHLLILLLGNTCDVSTFVLSTNVRKSYNKYTRNKRMNFWSMGRINILYQIPNDTCLIFVLNIAMKANPVIIFAILLTGLVKLLKLIYICFCFFFSENCNLSNATVFQAHITVSQPSTLKKFDEFLQRSL